MKEPHIVYYYLLVHLKVVPWRIE